MASAARFGFPFPELQDILHEESPALRDMQSQAKLSSFCFVFAGMPAQAKAQAISTDAIVWRLCLKGFAKAFKRCSHICAIV